MITQRILYIYISFWSDFHLFIQQILYIYKTSFLYHIKMHYLVFMKILKNRRIFLLLISLCLWLNFICINVWGGGKYALFMVFQQELKFYLHSISTSSYAEAVKIYELCVRFELLS